jgi:hypothetical protein
MQPRSMLRASGLLALACVAMFSQPRRADAQEIKRFFAPLIADPKQPHLRAPSASGAYRRGWTSGGEESRRAARAWSMDQ